MIVMRIMSIAILAVFLASSALADDTRVPLNEDVHLENGLLLVSASNQLRGRCDEVSLRFFRSLSFMQSLQSHARDLGYLDDEIDAYLKDKTEKARVKARARRYLESLGADFDDDATFCAVVRQEIATDHGIGPYFRLN